MTNVRDAFSVDFAHEIGRIKPLHGVNNGPQCYGGLNDLTPWHRRLGFPWVRLHDCDWPADYCVDLHTIIRDFDADPEDPASYDFGATDEYIGKIVALGSRIVYRLGCRIEWTGHRRHTHPPSDPQRWAQFCIGVIRHVNEGWAGGRQWNIEHWEIWNEAEHGAQMWSGSWEQYINLYVIAAKAIKRAFPQLQVGGPAYCEFDEPGKLKLERFVEACRERNAPLDFFSWHYYFGHDLSQGLSIAYELRQLLDRHGFTGTPAHLNEWNCMPGVAWGDLPRQEALLVSPVNASGVAACLALFQDWPIEMSFYYAADCGLWGLFSRGGVPQKNYRAIEAFCELLATPRRCSAMGSDAAAGVAILAGLADDGLLARVLIVNYVASGRCRFPLRLTNLPWQSATAMTLHRIDAQESLDSRESRELPPGDIAWDLDLPEATVLLMNLASAATGKADAPPNP